MVNLVYQAEVGDDSRIPHLDILIKSVFDYSIKTKSAYIFNRDISLNDYDPNISVDKTYTSLDIIYNPYFDQYDDILFVDTDVYVSENAKNIFEIKKESNTDVLSSSVLYYKETYPDYEEHSDILNSKMVMSTRFSEYRYVNTGIILFTKNGRLKAREKWDDWKFPKDHFGKQFHDECFINHMLNKYDFNVIELSSAWNFRHKSNRTHGEPHFYHFIRNTKEFIPDFLKRKGLIK